MAILLGSALSASALAWFIGRATLARVGIAILGLTVIVAAVILMENVEPFRNIGLGVSRGWGAYLCLGSGLLLVAGGVLAVMVRVAPEKD